MKARARRAASSRVFVSIRGSMAIAYCIGTLDKVAAEDLFDRVHDLAVRGVRGFVCSLGRCDHVHFHALDALARARRAAESQGGKFVFTGASDYVRQILDYGGLPRDDAAEADSHAAVWALRRAAGTEVAQPTAS